MYPGRDELMGFAKEALDKMLSYNVDKSEAYRYLTNQITLFECSYELQCCIFDVDPIEYVRVCSDQKKKM
jgi:hypothetical protein